MYERNRDLITVTILVNFLTFISGVTVPPSWDDEYNTNYDHDDFQVENLNRYGPEKTFSHYYNYHEHTDGDHYRTDAKLEHKPVKIIKHVRRRPVKFKRPTIIKLKKPLVIRQVPKNGPYRKPAPVVVKLVQSHPKPSYLIKKPTKVILNQYQTPPVLYHKQHVTHSQTDWTPIRPHTNNYEYHTIHPNHYSLPTNSDYNSENTNNYHGNYDETIKYHEIGPSGDLLSKNLKDEIEESKDTEYLNNQDLNEEEILPDFASKIYENDPFRRNGEHAPEETNDKSKHAEIKEFISEHEVPLDIPTKPIYPGEGQWARKGKQHKLFIRPETKSPQKEEEEEHEETRPDGYETFERGQEDFQSAKTNFNHDVNTFPQQHNLAHIESDYNPEQESEPLYKKPVIGFVPIKTYAQTRKTESTRHLPRSEAFKDAETEEELQNASRLREVIKNTRAHTVYTEEGYEDSAYDHAGHEKKAENKEGYAQKENSQDKHKELLKKRKKAKYAEEGGSKHGEDEESSSISDDSKEESEEYNDSEAYSDEDGDSDSSGTTYLNPGEKKGQASIKNYQKVQHPNAIKNTPKKNIGWAKTQVTKETQQTVIKNMGNGDVNTEINGQVEMTYTPDGKKIRKVKYTRIPQLKKSKPPQEPTNQTQTNLPDSPLLENSTSDPIITFTTPEPESSAPVENIQITTPFSIEELKPQDYSIRGDKVEGVSNTFNQVFVDTASFDSTSEPDPIEKIEEKFSEIEPQEEHHRAKRYDKEKLSKIYIRRRPQYYWDKNKKDYDTKSAKTNKVLTTISPEISTSEPKKSNDQPINKNKAKRLPFKRRLRRNTPQFGRTKRYQNDFPSLDINKLKYEIVDINKLADPTQRPDLTFIKYPYYLMKDPQRINMHSPIRYAEDMRNIPQKTQGGMEFYESTASIQCPEVESDINPIPERIRNKEVSEDDEEESEEEKVPELVKGPRLTSLGDKIDCMKVKYFGEEPLDSPFFQEEVIEAPTIEMVFGKKYKASLHKLVSYDGEGNSAAKQVSARDHADVEKLILEQFIRAAEPVEGNESVESQRYSEADAAEEQSYRVNNRVSPLNVEKGDSDLSYGRKLQKSSLDQKRNEYISSEEVPKSISEDKFQEYAPNNQANHRVNKYIHEESKPTSFKKQNWQKSSTLKNLDQNDRKNHQNLNSNRNKNAPDSILEKKTQVSALLKEQNQNKQANHRTSKHNYQGTSHILNSNENENAPDSSLEEKTQVPALLKEQDQNNQENHRTSEHFYTTNPIRNAPASIYKQKSRQTAHAEELNLPNSFKRKNFEESSSLKNLDQNNQADGRNNKEILTLRRNWNEPTTFYEQESQKTAHLEELNRNNQRNHRENKQKFQETALLEELDLPNSFKRPNLEESSSLKDLDQNNQADRRKNNQISAPSANWNAPDSLIEQISQETARLEELNRNNQRNHRENKQILQETALLEELDLPNSFKRPNLAESSFLKDLDQNNQTDKQKNIQILAPSANWNEPDSLIEHITQQTTRFEELNRNNQRIHRENEQKFQQTALLEELDLPNSFKRPNLDKSSSLKDLDQADRRQNNHFLAPSANWNAPDSFIEQISQQTAHLEELKRNNHRENEQILKNNTPTSFEKQNLQKPSSLKGLGEDTQANHQRFNQFSNSRRGTNTPDSIYEPKLDKKDLDRNNPADLRGNSSILSSKVNRNEAVLFNEQKPHQIAELNQNKHRNHRGNEKILEKNAPISSEKQNFQDSSSLRRLDQNIQANHQISDHISNSRRDQNVPGSIYELKLENSELAKDVDQRKPQLNEHLAEKSLPILFQRQEVPILKELNHGIPRISIANINQDVPSSISQQNYQEYSLLKDQNQENSQVIKQVDTKNVQEGIPSSFKKQKVQEPFPKNLDQNIQANHEHILLSNFHPKAPSPIQESESINIPIGDAKNVKRSVEDEHFVRKLYNLKLIAQYLNENKIKNEQKSRRRRDVAPEEIKILETKSYEQTKESAGLDAKISDIVLNLSKNDSNENSGVEDSTGSSSNEDASSGNSASRNESNGISSNQSNSNENLSNKNNSNGISSEQTTPSNQLTSAAPNHQTRVNSSTPRTPTAKSATEKDDITILIEADASNVADIPLQLPLVGNNEYGQIFDISKFWPKLSPVNYFHFDFEQKTEVPKTETASDQYNVLTDVMKNIQSSSNQNEHIAITTASPRNEDTKTESSNGHQIKMKVPHKKRRMRMKKNETAITTETPSREEISVRIKNLNHKEDSYFPEKDNEKSESNEEIVNDSEAQPNFKHPGTFKTIFVKDKNEKLRDLYKPEIYHPKLESEPSKRNPNKFEPSPQYINQQYSPVDTTYYPESYRGSTSNPYHHPNDVQYDLVYNFEKKSYILRPIKYEPRPVTETGFRPMLPKIITGFKPMLSPPPLPTQEAVVLKGIKPVKQHDSKIFKLVIPRASIPHLRRVVRPPVNRKPSLHVYRLAVPPPARVNPYYQNKYDNIEGLMPPPQHENTIDYSEYRPVTFEGAVEDSIALENSNHIVKRSSDDEESLPLTKLFKAAESNVKYEGKYKEIDRDNRQAKDFLTSEEDKTQKLIVGRGGHVHEKDSESESDPDETPLDIDQIKEEIKPEKSRFIGSATEETIQKNTDKKPDDILRDSYGNVIKEKNLQELMRSIMSNKKENAVNVDPRRGEPRYLQSKRKPKADLNEPINPKEDLETTTRKFKHASPSSSDFSDLAVFKVIETPTIFDITEYMPIIKPPEIEDKSQARHNFSSRFSQEDSNLPLPTERTLRRPVLLVIEEQIAKQKRPRSRDQSSKQRAHPNNHSSKESTNPTESSIPPRKGTRPPKDNTAKPSLFPRRWPTTQKPRTPEPTTESLRKKIIQRNRERGTTIRRNLDVTKTSNDNIDSSSQKDPIIQNKSTPTRKVSNTNFVRNKNIKFIEDIAKTGIFHEEPNDPTTEKSIPKDAINIPRTRTKLTAETSTILYKPKENAEDENDALEKEHENDSEEEPEADHQDAIASDHSEQVELIDGVTHEQILRGPKHGGNYKHINDQKSDETQRKHEDDEDYEEIDEDEKSPYESGEENYGTSTNYGVSEEPVSKLPEFYKKGLRKLPVTRNFFSDRTLARHVNNLKDNTTPRGFADASSSTLKYIKIDKKPESGSGYWSKVIKDPSMRQYYYARD